MALILGQTASRHHTYAQTDKNGPPHILSGVDCNSVETVKALLDETAISAGKDSTIFIIARLGTGEHSRKFTRHRLFITSDYLIASRGVSKDKVITAEGERVRGFGLVEVYVGGKLFVIFKMKRNRSFGDGCSGPEG